MATERAIHVLPGEQDDWIVREEGGRELGHYASKREAQSVGHKVARKRKVELLIYGLNGEALVRSRPAKSWLRRPLGR